MACMQTFRYRGLHIGQKICRCRSTSTHLTNSQVRRKRNEAFEKEQARQLALVTRVEKIQVQHRGPPEDCTLVMNKGLSTPFNCAMHIQEVLMTRSVIALVNGEPWDMHHPLTEDCELRFLHFRENDPRIVNQIFWRSCSFVLGHILETAFKEDYNIQLCSFPRPDVISGSFVLDADLSLPEWKPSSVELSCLSRIGAKLQHSDLRFERLDIDAALAQTMFEDNRFKSQQIPAIAGKSRSGSSVTVYRMGSHIDISRGPMVATTDLIGRFNVTAVHDITSSRYGPLKRVQGLAIPKQLQMHYWTYEYLCRRAAKLNPAPVAGELATQVPTLEVAQS